MNDPVRELDDTLRVGEVLLDHSFPRDPRVTKAVQLTDALLARPEFIPPL